MKACQLVLLILVLINLGNTAHASHVVKESAKIWGWTEDYTVFLDISSSGNSVGVRALAVSTWESDASMIYSSTNKMRVPVLVRKKQLKKYDIKKSTECEVSKNEVTLPDGRKLRVESEVNNNKDGTLSISVRIIFHEQGQEDLIVYSEQRRASGQVKYKGLFVESAGLSPNAEYLCVLLKSKGYSELINLVLFDVKEKRLPLGTIHSSERLLFSSWDVDEAPTQRRKKKK